MKRGRRTITVDNNGPLAPELTGSNLEGMFFFPKRSNCLGLYYTCVINSMGEELLYKSQKTLGLNCPWWEGNCAERGERRKEKEARGNVSEAAREKIKEIKH